MLLLPACFPRFALLFGLPFGFSSLMRVRALYASVPVRFCRTPSTYPTVLNLRFRRVPQLKRSKDFEHHFVDTHIACSPLPSPAQHGPGIIFACFPALSAPCGVPLPTSFSWLWFRWLLYRRNGGFVQAGRNYGSHPNEAFGSVKLNSASHSCGLTLRITANSLSSVTFVWSEYSGASLEGQLHARPKPCRLPAEAVKAITSAFVVPFASNTLMVLIGNRSDCCRDGLGQQVGVPGRR